MTDPRSGDNASAAPHAVPEPDEGQPGAGEANDFRDRTLAIAMLVIAYVFFTGLDATAKLLSSEFETALIVWFRNIVSFGMVVVVLGPVGTTRALACNRLWLQILRGLLLLLSTLFNFLALRHLPLVITVSIMFSAPLMITALSVPILKETVGIRRWMAVLAGFIGVLVILRPGLGGLHWSAVFSALAALSFSLYSITTRLVSYTDSSKTSWVYSALVATALITPVLPFVWQSPGDLTSWALMLSMGLYGGIGHYLMIAAHQRAPSSVLAPFIYTHIISMATAGYLLFGDVPTPMTLVGVAIIIASGLYVLHRERLRGAGAASKIS